MKPFLKPDIQVVAKIEGGDMLNRNFWRFLTGVLDQVDVSITERYGSTKTMRTGSAIMCAGTSLRFGTSTTPPSWDQISIQSGEGTGEGTDLGRSLYVRNGNEIVFEHSRFVTSSAVRECALYVGLYDTAGNGWTVCIARSVLPSAPSPNSIIRYRIVFRRPFVMNFGNFMFGLLSYTNIGGMVDVNGSTYTARTSGNPNASKPVLRVGVGTNPWSVNDYALTSPITLSTFFSLVNDVSYTSYYIFGMARLTANMTITELGLFKGIFDTGGSSRDTMLLRYVLPTPIEKKAGEYITASILIYASA